MTQVMDAMTSNMMGVARPRERPLRFQPRPLFNADNHQTHNLLDFSASFIEPRVHEEMKIEESPWTFLISLITSLLHLNHSAVCLHFVPLYRTHVSRNYSHLMTLIDNLVSVMERVSQRSCEHVESVTEEAIPRFHWSLVVGGALWSHQTQSSKSHLWKERYLANHYWWAFIQGPVSSWASSFQSATKLTFFSVVRSNTLLVKFAGSQMICKLPLLLMRSSLSTS